MSPFSRFRLPSALGAIVAATLVTIISAVPEVVHAGDRTPSCGAPVPSCFGPVRY
ncbi:hypothetical protein [Sphingosinicella microcystinivorans]|uniref:hypothetical protein n=1 Tax=Sphingosinicella microcystinivorans TaxID=335406 RepID=UPI0022F3C14A|nr:hypothetical protein [Sphingosinicella microcystinivorans]WBX85947.1 hypothetical protein PE061_08570 [Sphingosinicella microcystinivorans]